MDYFVDKNSIVRKIWGNGDVILLIFAGAAAEFALNKAVDWLYFTGKLPSDPLGRLFSTVTYARKIVFSNTDGAIASIKKITAIHHNVETDRNAKIPDWAYRDVLFMLIDYSIRSFELLKRPLNDYEKEEVFDVFNRVGKHMLLSGLPANYNEWLIMRENHIYKNLLKSDFTVDLFKQYKNHLGWLRFQLMLNAQQELVPPLVSKLLNLKNTSLPFSLIRVYKTVNTLHLGRLLKQLILPRNYLPQIKALDV